MCRSRGVHLNTAIVILGLLMQAPSNDVPVVLDVPHSDSGPSREVCSPCYNSARWCQRTIGESHSAGCWGCSVKPIGDLYQHYPYVSQPKIYYYLRPYNYLHVREKAGQAVAMGFPPELPFSNSIFVEVYESVEASFIPGVAR